MSNTKIIKTLCLSALCFGANVHIAAPGNVSASDAAQSSNTASALHSTQILQSTQGVAAGQSAVSPSQMQEQYMSILSIAQKVRSSSLLAYLSENKSAFFEAVDNNNEETRKKIIEGATLIAEKEEKYIDNEIKKLDIPDKNSTDEQKRAFIERKIMEFQLSINIGLIGAHGESSLSGIINIIENLTNDSKENSEKLGSQYPIFFERARKMLCDKLLSVLPAGSTIDEAEKIFDLEYEKSNLEKLQETEKE